jgi:hypothetical protein
MADSTLDPARRRRNKRINRALASQKDRPMPVSQRLYIVDTKTNEKFELAYAIGIDWFVRDMETFGVKFDDWLTGRDHDAAKGFEPTGLVLKTEGVNE